MPTKISGIIENIFFKFNQLTWTKKKSQKPLVFLFLGVKNLVNFCKLLFYNISIILFSGFIKYSFVIQLRKMLGVFYRE